MCGFLRGQVLPQPPASRKIGGVTGKRKANQEPVSNTGAGDHVAQKIPCPDQRGVVHRLADSIQNKRRRTHPTQAEGDQPQCGIRPMVEMVIRWHPEHRHQVRVLLDSGCTTPLISTPLAERLKIPCLRRKEQVELRDFTGELVKGAGQLYTQPLLLQHRRHYTKEVFKVTTLEPGVDVFLPFWWTLKHDAPHSTWHLPELRFGSPYCMENCTKSAAKAFSLTLDESIVHHQGARIIGYVSAVAGKEDPLERVPEEFRLFLDIMGKEAADALPEHRSYDHEIRVKEGETPPWGPIYPLSETELQALREYLKEMLSTGKIRRSSSSAGSPILFVPKPHGRGL